MPPKHFTCSAVFCVPASTWETDLTSDVPKGETHHFDNGKAGNLLYMAHSSVKSGFNTVRISCPYLTIYVVETAPL